MRLKNPMCLFTVLAVLAAAPLKAEEKSAMPVKEGDHCVLWYDAPRSFLAGLKERRAFVRVLEVRGTWIHAELFFSETTAKIMAAVGEIQKDTEAGKRFLAELGKTKEELLKETADEPLTAKDMARLWLNLNAVEAVTTHQFGQP